MRRRKMYRIFDEMLDDVLERKPVGVSDLKETEISALASKINQRRRTDCNF